jgi:hypothetical protein
MDVLKSAAVFTPFVLAILETLYLLRLLYWLVASIRYLVVKVPDDRFGSAVAIPSSNGAHIVGFAGDLDPNPLPVMVI